MKNNADASEKLVEIGIEIAAEASHIKRIVADALEEGLETVKDTVKDVARRTIKHGRNTAEDLLETSTHQVQQHPFQSIGITFGVGLAFGLVIGWLAAGKEK